MMLGVDFKQGGGGLIFRVCIRKEGDAIVRAIHYSLNKSLWLGMLPQASARDSVRTGINYGSVSPNTDRVGKNNGQLCTKPTLPHIKLGPSQLCASL